MNYEELKAGRELDALIAEKVMGWIREKHIGDDVGWLHPPYDDKRMHWAAEWDENGLPDWLPQYSTSIGAAWEIVKRLSKHGLFMHLERGRYARDENLWCCIFKNDPMSISGQLACFETAPLAICVAALKLVEEQSPTTWPGALDET